MDDIGRSRIDTALRSHLRGLFRSTRLLAPAGNLSAAVVFLLVVGDRVDRADVWWWFSGVVATVAWLVFISFVRPAAMLHPRQPQVSRVALAVHATFGTLWGGLPWLGHPDVASDYQWIALSFMFAVSAGALSGIMGMTPVTIAVLTPMWSMGSLSFAAAGQPLIAVACLVFLGLVLNDTRTSGKLLVELIRLRITSAEAAARAEWEASHDPLTGLPNRLGLHELTTRVSQHERERTTAMFIDLDHFKEVNDRFGHPVGDALLVQVADRLRAEVGDGDVIGRLGGDEFLLIMFRMLSDAEAATTAQRIIAVLEEPFRVDRIGDEEIYVSASIGVTRSGHPIVDDLTGSSTGSSTGIARSVDVARLVQESDQALYEAKRNGRRQAVVFDARLRDRLDERSGLEMALRRAVRSGEMEAWGQPVYDLRTGEVAWVELLARWETSPGLFVPPSVFVPLAEEIGVVDDLGRRMLRHATDALIRWTDHPALRTADVAVNISAMHIMRDNLVEDVSTLMACHGLAAHRLIVELTESHRLTDVQLVASTFEQLGSLGVRLAVDDFGTGYSSLGQLLALPVSIVKIDRSLTAGCDQDAHRSSVVAAIGHLAASLGHLVVAEGVETQGERDALAAMGLDQAQGYLLCPPLPLAALEDELRSGREAERRWYSLAPHRSGIHPPACS